MIDEYDDFDTAEGDSLSEDIGLSTVEQVHSPARTIQTVTVEIKALHAQAQQVVLGYAIEIGRRLTEAKELLPHGQWGNWLKEEVSFSKSTANNFMRIFDEYGEAQLGLFGPEAKSQALGNLPYTKALALLAIPAEEREEFVKSTPVADMSSRELEAAIRERDASKREAAEMQAALAAQTALKASLEAELARTATQVSEVKRELTALKSRPVEVAVETVVDEAAVAEVKKAADAAHKEQEKAIKSLEAKLKVAQEERALAEEALRSAESRTADTSALEAQVVDLQKQLAASDADVAAFKVYFMEFQENVADMVKIINALESRGNPKANNLKTALKATLQSKFDSLSKGS